MPQPKPADLYGAYRLQSETHDNYVLEMRVGPGKGTALSLSGDVFQESQPAMGRILRGSFHCRRPGLKSWDDSTGRWVLTGKIQNDPLSSFCFDEADITFELFTFPNGNEVARFAGRKESHEYRFTGRRESEWTRRLEVLVDSSSAVGTIDWGQIVEGGADSQTLKGAYERVGFKLDFIEGLKLSRSDAAWDRAELHHLMLERIGADRHRFGEWALWGFVARKYRGDGGGRGVMFDHSLGEEPTSHPWRQGFALFTDEIEATANRVAGRNLDEVFARTLIHEIGHGLNLPHADEDGRSRSLTWMNRPLGYHAGENTYWSQFSAFDFDEDEAQHLHHAYLRRIIPGGSDFEDSLGTAADRDGGLASAPLVEGRLPLALDLRSKGYFQFMEPIFVEARLKNQAGVDLRVPRSLSPELQGVRYWIRRPNGRIQAFRPLLVRCGEPEAVSLAPTATTKEGADRWSREIHLSYGADGFYFDEPGRYEIRAAYFGEDGALAVSRPHWIRIGLPKDRWQDKKACDYFSDDVGRCLYLDGSPSDYLAKGRDFLLHLLELKTYASEPMAVAWSRRLARGELETLYRLGGQDAGWSVARKPDPEKALELSEAAIETFRRSSEQWANLPHYRLAQMRAHCHAMREDLELACQELDHLREDLRQRGVKGSVLQRVKQKTVSWEDAISRTKESRNE